MTTNARPAPAWDEEAAALAVSKALREHGGWFADLPADEMDCCARAALAVVREHLPVKPSRETVRLAQHRALMPQVMSIFAAVGGTQAAYDALLDTLADAVLDLWPGESRATVQAEALRDAADEHEARLPDGTGNGRAYNSYTVAAMLRARADRLAAEGGADRG